MGILRLLPCKNFSHAVFFLALCIWVVTNGWTAPIEDLAEGAGLQNETNGNISFEMENLEQQLLLTREFRNASFASYAAKAADTSLPEPARVFLYKVMAGRASKLTLANRTALGELMLKTVEQGASQKLKAHVLTELGMLPNVDPIVFTSRLKSTDPDLKSAAYAGLARKVRMNRRKGLTEVNRAIFQVLKGLYETDPDLDLFRSLAMMSEDFSRDYVALKSSGDRQKILTILYMDEDFNHLGLARTALQGMNAPDRKSELSQALRYAIKRPEELLIALKTGSKEDNALIGAFLEAFPEDVKTQPASIGIDSGRGL